MHLYENGLLGGAAAINLNEGKINTIEWKLFSETLEIEKKYPGISGIGIIYKVIPEKLEQFLKEQKKLRPNYHIHPPHNQKEFWPITYIEPLAPNFKAVGLDMAHEQNRFEAAKKAQDTGTTQITGPIVLVQDSEKTAGFLLYLPFYKGGPYRTLAERRRNLKGLVYAPFIVDRLMEGTLQSTKREISIKITDDEQVIFNEHQETSYDYDQSPLFESRFDLKIYGRVWNFKVQTSKAFRKSSSIDQSIYILLFGILIDLLIFFVFIVLSNSNKNALDYAKKVTLSLKKSNDELGQFAYRTSHDLKAPLVTIKGLADFIYEDLNEGDYDEAKKNILEINKLVTKLNNLVIDILNLAKADLEELDTEEVDIHSILSNIKDNLQSFYNSSEVKFEIEIEQSLNLVVSKVRITQVLENLISNAMKYKDSQKDESFVRISAKREGKNVEIRVADNGLGIPEKYREKTFKMFQRFHPKAAEGSGLGMYIIQKHVDNMNGEINYESSDKGTTFKISIPRNS